jgi:transposase-like protein
VYPKFRTEKRGFYKWKPIIFNLKIIQKWGNASDAIMTRILKLSGAARAVVLEAFKEQKTLAQLSSEFKLHSNQISDWKKQAIVGLPMVFGVQQSVLSDEKEEELTAPLYQQIGQLKVENDFLKKNCGRIHRLIDLKKKRMERAK